jgi:hypothetical protein
MIFPRYFFLNIFYITLFLNLFGYFMFIPKLLGCSITHDTYTERLNKLTA